MLHATYCRLLMRPQEAYSDEVADVMDSGLALSNAPARRGTAFCVPKVIGEEDEG